MTSQPLRFVLMTLLLVAGLSLLACSDSKPNGNSSSSSSPSNPPAYEGYVDVLNCDAIIAWGWDANRPNEPVKLDIYDGKVLIASINADNFRQDLQTAGKGNGKHYVFWPTPVQLKDGRKHEIAVKFGGTSLDVGLPQEITCNFQK